MTNQEFEKFDAGILKVLSVSRAELEKREKEWKRKRERAKQKRAKTLPASRVSIDKD